MWKVLSTGVGFVLSAFGEESPLMGALKLVAGLGSLWLADRILKPWKLIGDAARLTRFLTKGMKKNTVKSQKQLHKQLVRKRAANIKRIRQMRKLTAVAGKGYPINTTGGTITMTLPASASAGDTIKVVDYARTFGTNKLTIGRNSQNINGAASDLDLTKNNTATQLIYVDATEGWRVVFTGSLSDIQSSFVTATGGNSIVTCGNFKMHIFTGPGTFCVSQVGCSANETVDYMVVAGGGGDGAQRGDGGAACSRHAIR